ncbi:unnamed protein product [Clonostachys byssicola]|uniref:Gfo/Idh/MocA-like oxidoreductase N-terminal domain-containing protein n=1 Tax=Clonostachys byssicola TaxID=160290 RepID=A0A9N9UVW6_9HYPO|nr:unnamed protein product [Clonostachys byssicola]
MVPIRIGLIGLNADFKPDALAGQWGIIHIAALKASPLYQVVAVCNSTAQSAARAIAAHGLGEHVRAYGSAEDIAADPEVDMISVIVNVDKHYDLAKPAILAGKNILVEFPLASNMEQMEELQKLAHEKGVKVVIGAQAIADPVHHKIKKMLRDGTIGDVVSSYFDTAMLLTTADGWSDAVAFWLNMEHGGSRFTIGLGHSLASYVDALGEFTTVQSIFKIQDKTVKLLDTAGTVTDPAYPVTVPDSFLIQGILSSGGIASYALRFVRSTVNGRGGRWLISGTKGELELTYDQGMMYQGDLGSGAGAKLRVKTWGAEQAEEIEVLDRHEGAHITDLHKLAKNTGRLYEAFAKGEEDKYMSIDEAVRLHKFMQRIATGAEWAP